jgi:hypothetical protein
MATVDSDKVVCRGIHAIIVAVLVEFEVTGSKVKGTGALTSKSLFNLTRFSTFGCSVFVV